MSWLRAIPFRFTLLAFVLQPASASAFASAHPQARVSAFELVALASVGASAETSAGVHEGIGDAYDENASGAAPDASKPAHSVFNVARNRVLGLVDEAWAARGSHTIHPGSGNWNYRVDMGRVIGTEGQTAINISVRPGTSEIVTAFPVP